MSTAPEYRAHQEWLGYVQPVGLVVSIPEAAAFPIGSADMSDAFKGVTMRLLHVNREGMLWGLPRRSGVDVSCSPSSENACSFNRQDWAVLLKLKPLAPMMQPRPFPGPAPQPACCVNCVLGADPPVPRCPVQGGASLP